MTFLAWVTSHWPDILQNIGVIGGLLFTAVSLRSDANARQVSNLFSLVAAHREIWSRLHSQPELARVLDPKADISTTPITLRERLFVRDLILHLSASYYASRRGVLVKIEGVSADVRSFLSLPIPIAVWRDMKPLQNRKFVMFVEKLGII